MSCCCSPRTFKMPTVLPTNRCDWCDSDLNNQIIYILDTQTIEDKFPTSFRVGDTCCVARMKHGEFCNAFIERWNALPVMDFMFEARPENVTQMFKHAKELHFKKADRFAVKNAFRGAWNTYNRLSEADKALVTH